MHKSIQGFTCNVFCGLLPRFDLMLQNELTLFWHKTWKVGVGWCRCNCEKGFESKVAPQSTKEAPRCKWCSAIFKEGMSSWAPSTYEGSGSSITRHFWNVNPIDVDKSTPHLCDCILSSQKLHSYFFLLLLTQLSY
jgi:hypothetical protein